MMHYSSVHWNADWTWAEALVPSARTVPAWRPLRYHLCTVGCREERQLAIMIDFLILIEELTFVTED